jgi:hypothetical protein
MVKNSHIESVSYLSKNEKKRWLYAVLLMPCFVYFTILFIVSENIPIGDDYDVFLEYINLSPNDRLIELFSQHNEHRPAFSRIVCEFSYRIIGCVDFKVLILIGNVALVLMLFIVYKLFWTVSSSVMFFIPVPYFFMFAPQTDNVAWATGSLQNFYVVLFSVVAIWCFVKGGYVCFVISMLFAVLSIYTSGSGVVTFIVLSLLALQELLSKAKKNIYPLVGVLIVFELVLYFYFIDYNKPEHHPSVSVSTEDFMSLIHYHILFMGSYAKHEVLSLVLGFALLVGFVFLTIHKYFERRPVIYYCLLFIIGNAALASLTRSGYGVEQALSSRYIILSSMYIVLLYLSMIDLFGEKLIENRYFYFLNMFVILICSYAQVCQFKILSEESMALRDGMKLWSETETGLMYPDQLRAGEILKESIVAGKYVLE